MMTFRGKVTLAILVLALVGYGLWLNRAKIMGTRPPYQPRETISASDFPKLPSEEPTEGYTPKKAPISPGSPEYPAGPLNRPLRISINTWGGYAPGLVANGGAKPNTDCVYWKNFGLKVEFVLIDDWDQKAAAFASGNVDMMGTTVDFFANQYSTFRDKGFIAKGFLLHDWSRGGDGIVASKNIRSVEDLKGKKIATTKYTPSHFFLLYLLYNSGLSPKDILDLRKNLVFTDTAARAAQMFVARKVDAAVTWEPDLSDACTKGEGHKLVTTSSATNLIGDLLVVRNDFANKYPQEINKFIKGWFKGIEMIKEDPEGAYRITGKALAIPPEPDVKGMLEGLKFTDYFDNKKFFGLEGTGVSHYENLFQSASLIWRKEGVIASVAQPADAVNLSFLNALAPQYATAPLPKEEFKFTAPPKKASPLIHKKATIHFATGSAWITRDSKYVLDDIGEIMLSLGNAYMRVEGNTDSVGDDTSNLVLSQKRAAAVRNYLVKKYGLNARRFICIGNGERKPVASNDTEEGRELNRRTDFFLITAE